MKKMPVCFTLMLLAVFTLCMTEVARANLVTNGDFSSGLAGWNTSNVIVTDYASMPANYTNRWDLSSWNDVMDGSFALLGRGGGMWMDFPLIPGQKPSSLSFNYAVAWADPVIPDANGNPYAYGYFYVETFGITEGDAWRRSLTYSEIPWLITDSNVKQDVFTGTMYTENFLTYPADIEFNEIFMQISALNPNSSLTQIVGIDNLKMEVSPPAPVPTPEPSTVLMLGFGLAGLAGFGRGLKRSWM